MVDVSSASLVLDLDIVFPRMEAYSMPNILPLTVSVYDFVHFSPNYSSLSWSIVQEDKSDSFDSQNPPVELDSGRFAILNTTDASLKSTVILVSYTNVSAWANLPYHASTSLDFVVHVDDAVARDGGRGFLPEVCPNDASSGTSADGMDFGDISFSVETDATAAAANKTLVKPDVGAAPGCPLEGSSYSATEYKNTTTGEQCFDNFEVGMGIPSFDTVSCTDRATIPAAVLTNIGSLATSLASAGIKGNAVTSVTAAAGSAAATTGASGTAAATGTDAATGGTKTSGAGSSTSQTSVNTAAGKMPSLGRVIAAAGVLSLLVSNTL
ncbi:hypothetical protein SEUCBS140593_008119 [Sporothrix eucalyptigena]|uniref:Uncharacterized protein n=1 Tax=Sporothrix eucalyptigena TaxID=1812306 RepID=A0ABP0CLD2_9PEZI